MTRLHVIDPKTMETVRRKLEAVERAHRVRALDRWIERELERGEERCGALAAKTSILPEAEAYFRQLVDGAR